METHDYEELPMDCKIFNFKQMKKLRRAACRKGVSPESLSSEFGFVKPANWTLTNDKEWFKLFCSVSLKSFFTKDFELKAKCLA